MDEKKLKAEIENKQEESENGENKIIMENKNLKDEIENTLEETERDKNPLDVWTSRVTQKIFFGTHSTEADPLIGDKYTNSYGTSKTFEDGVNVYFNFYYNPTHINNEKIEKIKEFKKEGPMEGIIVTTMTNGKGVRRDKIYDLSSKTLTINEYQNNDFTNKISSTPIQDVKIIKDWLVSVNGDINFLGRDVLLPVSNDNLPIKGDTVNMKVDINSSPLNVLLPVSNDNLSIKGHTLELEVEGRLIYNHLQIYKDELLQNHSTNQALIQALPQLTEKFKSFKLYNPDLLLEEQNNELRRKTIIDGNSPASGTTSTGVPGVKYMRKEEYVENEFAKKIIEDLQSYGLSDKEAMKLFILIAGLPKSGENDVSGYWYNVGGLGIFPLSKATKQLERGGGASYRVECLHFSENGVRIATFNGESAYPLLKQ